MGVMFEIKKSPLVVKLPTGKTICLESSFLFKAKCTSTTAVVLSNVFTLSTKF